MGVQSEPLSLDVHGVAKLQCKIPASLLKMESWPAVLRGCTFMPIFNTSASELNDSSHITGRWFADLKCKIANTGGKGLQKALDGIMKEACEMVNGKVRAPGVLGRTPGVPAQVYHHDAKSGYSVIVALTGDYTVGVILGSHTMDDDRWNVGTFAEPRSR